MTEEQIIRLIDEKVFNGCVITLSTVTRSLNACALMEAEIGKDKNLVNLYVMALRGVCWQDVPTADEALPQLDWYIVTATPQQRCEAALRALGVWEE